MRLKEVFIAACAGASFCVAQSINILGTVTDSTGTAIPGAAVKLEDANVSDTTGPDGAFTLADVGIRPGNDLNSLAPSPIALHHGQIRISLSEKALVAISVRNVGGRRIFRSEKIYNIGTHTLPSHSNATGIHLYRVAIGQDNYTFKSSPVGSFSGEILVSGKSIGRSLSKQAKASAGFRDVISVIKEGQLNYRDSIRTPDTSGIVVKMIPNADTVTDADGNVYQSVRIGSQVWTAENLKTTKYNDGTPIPHVTDSTEWYNLTAGAYCYYGNDAANKDRFGAMFNWYAVLTGKLAPAGWHVPTDEEWDTLENYLILNGYNWDGTTDTTAKNKVGKSLAAKTDWAPSTTAGAVGNDPSTNNATGFSALPGGFRRPYTGKPDFTKKDINGYWWSSTEQPDSIPNKAWNNWLDHDWQGRQRASHYKVYALSVRLIRDN